MAGSHEVRGSIPLGSTKFSATFGWLFYLPIPTTYYCKDSRVVALRTQPTRLTSLKIFQNRVLHDFLIAVY